MRSAGARSCLRPRACQPPADVSTSSPSRPRSYSSRIFRGLAIGGAQQPPVESAETRIRRASKREEASRDAESLYQYAKAARPGSRPPLPFLEAGQAELQHLNGPTLCRLVWSVSRLGGRPSAAWLASFWTALGGVLERFGSQDLAMVAAACAALGVSPPAAEQRAFLARSTAVLRASAGAPASGVPGMELAHLSHGLAAWGATVDGEWEGHFWAQVEARASEAVEVAAEGAEAEAEEAEEEEEENSFLEEAAQARRAGRGLTGRELSNLARNAVRLGLRPPPSTLRAMQEAAMGSVRSSSPRELALTQWGLTRLGAKAREDLLDAVCGEARRGLADWGITELSMLLWSLAELRHRPSDAWLAACAARTAPALRSASPLALANVAWAHAVLDWAPPSGDDWRQALSEGVQRCLAERLPLPEAARLVWSCTILQLYELPCLPPLWRHMLRLLVPGGGRGVEACIMHECSLLAAAEAPGLLTPPPQQQLAAAAATAWATQGRFIARAPTSTLQKRVRAVLHNRLQLAAESTICERSGWGVDLALPQAGSLRLALQVDGPARFTSNTWQCVGSTRARDRALRAAGWTVLSLPFFTLDAQQGGAALAIYLKRRLAETANAHIEATRRAEAEARPKAAAQGPRTKPKAAAVPSAR